MRCDDERCTGNHRYGPNTCPRRKEDKLASGRKVYAEQTWFEHHAKQLKTRRYKALGRLKARGVHGT
jgi:hypothetical protein